MLCASWTQGGRNVISGHRRENKNKHYAQASMVRQEEFVASGLCVKSIVVIFFFTTGKVFSFSL
jgi:hypothetical protein